MGEPDVECWACALAIEPAAAVVVYRDQQGGLHREPDVRGLWQQVYLCAECAEVHGWA